MNVFVLHHVSEVAPDRDDVKLIGVYSSAERAKEAVQRALRLPGFREAPDGFTVDAYELDTDHWTEGYLSIS